MMSVYFLTCSMGKLDGELIMSVVEHQETCIGQINPLSLEQPSKLTNQELTIGRVSKLRISSNSFIFCTAEQLCVFLGCEEVWSEHDILVHQCSMRQTPTRKMAICPLFAESDEFQVLPALFGGKIPRYLFGSLQLIRKRLRAITKDSGSSPLVRLSLSSAVDVHLGQSSGNQSFMNGLMRIHLFTYLSKCVERFKMLVVLGCFLSIATSL
ncbi:hypothetical protein GQ600_13686 [Phytophthora cactorum]|nr:hypothetical protein GQ600_13686 [Phytophthora cactorum]